MATTEELNRKKFSNWMQSVQSLDITKKALHGHVLDVWTKRLMSWGKDARDGILTFICCVANNNINLCRKKWTCECNHCHCAKILDLLLNLQQNPGFSIVWNSNICENIAKGIELDSQDERQTHGIDDIPRVETTSISDVTQCLFNPSQYATETRKSSDGGEKYKGIFDDCKIEHIWCIANMFMQRGKNKTNVSNTGPHDTDAAMFFRMMKNCKLFEIENENDLYDDIIECRDRLFHSATNRIPRATAKSYFDVMIAILEKFEVPECKAAINRLKKMLEETIMCISIPDINIELVKEALRLKKLALGVDKETDKAKGFSDADTDFLQEDTNTALANAEYSENTIDIIRSDDTGNKAKNPKKYFELATSLLQKSWHNPNIAADIEAQLIPVLGQIVDTAAESDASFRTEAEEISEQVKSCERSDLQQKSNTKPGNKNMAAGGHTGCNKDTDISETVKDSPTHFENMTSLLKSFSHNHGIAEAISKNLYPLLDVVVEAASKSDKTLREKIEEIYKQDNSEQQTRKDIDQGQEGTFKNTGESYVLPDDIGAEASISGEVEFERNNRSGTNQIDTDESEESGSDSYMSYDKDSNQTDDGERKRFTNGVDLDRGVADSLRPRQPSPTTIVEQIPGKHRPHLWSVTCKQSYNIKAAQGENCYIWGCCQLPTGEILLADFHNRRLKKLDARYQVVSVCILACNPKDVCYISNNEVVVSSLRKLQFVNVVNSMTPISSVKTEHECHGLTCHGFKLYVLTADSVYMYLKDGTPQRILYTLPRDIRVCPWYIEVNDKGSKIYITTSGHLITIDSSGKHLFTLTDQELVGDCDACLDGAGNVLVCNHGTGSILQVSHDGKYIRGTIVNKSDDIENPEAICFDRHKSALICTGCSNDLTVLQLK